MTQTTPAPVSPRSEDRTFRRLARTAQVVSVVGIAVAVVVGIVTMAQPTEDANLGLASAALIALPMLLPLGLASGALPLRRSSPAAAMTLAAVAAALLGTGLLVVAAIFLPSLA
ncbi:hypothetical protein [Nocardioides pantholopis]|uniref:hypothetical protein n=1 Tax=Nocardioides pantholopis TaxID=2483798 RepID=UPI000F074D26|nr:hypothetical protein [Nocardioides pantholopis]